MPERIDIIGSGHDKSIVKCSVVKVKVKVPSARRINLARIDPPPRPARLSQAARNMGVPRDTRMIGSAFLREGRRRRDVKPIVLGFIVGLRRFIHTGMVDNQGRSNVSEE